MGSKAKGKSSYKVKRPSEIEQFDHETARTLSIRIAEENRLDFAQTFASAVIRFCCEARGQTLNSMWRWPVPRLALSEEAEATAKRFGVALSKRNLRDLGDAVGAIYMAALPETFRAKHGIFYTPPALVDQLLGMAVDAGIDWRTARILDPACGGGAFLLAAADQIVAALPDADPAFVVRHINTHLRGYDIDSFGVWLAEALLCMKFRDLMPNFSKGAPSIVDNRDSLAIQNDDLNAYDLVVGNPPYGRVSLEIGRRKFFERSVYGHANLYGLFTDAALHWAKPGGVVAYVTPPSMLSGLYYKSLRELLAKEAPPLAINFVAEREGVFADVLQETMLATYRRGGFARGGKVGFIAVGQHRSRDLIARGSIALPQNSSTPWLLPRSTEQIGLVRRLREMPHRLRDYGYTVSTGPLVWNRFKGQFAHQYEAGSYPVIWAESVTSDGRFEWRSEKRNHAPWFIADRSTDDWMIAKSGCILVQRTTAKEQSRRLIAAELPGRFVRKYKGVMIENHLNMVRPAVDKPKVPPAVIAALLNSAVVDAAFRCINGSVAVSAFELEELPLPSPNVMMKIASLILRNPPYAKIEKIISAAYRVSDVAAAA